MIEQFQAEYRWLSNFAKVSIILDGVEYRSVEHAYMSAKSDVAEWKMFCCETEDPKKVKRASSSISLVVDWDRRKVDVMRRCIDQKYAQEPYRALLLATGGEKIQEGNKWGDTFWGVDLESGIGKNMLGKLIMEKRQLLRGEEQSKERVRKVGSFRIKVHSKKGFQNYGARSRAHKGTMG